MKKPDTILDEIHAIRRQIDERTKNMTHDEIDEYFRDLTNKAAREFGFKIYKNVEEAERDMAMV